MLGKYRECTVVVTFRLFFVPDIVTKLTTKGLRKLELMILFTSRLQSPIWPNYQGSLGCLGVYYDTFNESTDLFNSIQ